MLNGWKVITETEDRIFSANSDTHYDVILPDKEELPKTFVQNQKKTGESEKKMINWQAKLNSQTFWQTIKK